MKKRAPAIALPECDRVTSPRVGFEQHISALSSSGSKRTGNRDSDRLARGDVVSLTASGASHRCPARQTGGSRSADMPVALRPEAPAKDSPPAFRPRQRTTNQSMLALCRGHRSGKLIRALQVLLD